MVSNTSSMTPEFRRFLKRLKKELRPTRVLLFGSRARGEHRRDSDYDLVVVSRKFLRVRWIWRAPMVFRLWDLPLDLDAICLTPSEFRLRSKELSIVGIAAREGVVL